MDDDQVPCVAKQSFGSIVSDLSHRTLIEHDPQPIAEPDAVRVPLTIICGFLGAGKSTLLKYATISDGIRILFIFTGEFLLNAMAIASP